MGKEKILVTGGTGLLGSYLLRALLLENKEVKALYRNQYPLLLSQEEINRINWVKGDILDVSALQDTMSGISTGISLCRHGFFQSCTGE